MVTWQEVFDYLKNRYEEAKRLGDDEFCIRLSRALAALEADPYEKRAENRSEDAREAKETNKF